MTSNRPCRERVIQHIFIHWDENSRLSLRIVWFSRLAEAAAGRANAASDPMTHFFASKRLIARRFTPLDLDAFVAMRADPEVARFQDWGGFTREDGRAFLEENPGREPGTPGWFQFALERKEDGRFVGDCGLRTADPGIRWAQVGYTIDRPHWNQGYATEAVRALIAYVFGSFAIDRIGASVDPRHGASIRVLEKAGFIAGD